MRPFRTESRSPAAATVVVMSLLIMIPSAARAQTPAAVPLSELLPTLYQTVIAAEGDVLGGFTGIFEEIARRARLDTASQVGNLVSSQVSSFPLVSSGGGFTWTFDESTALFLRSSDSFGPIFAERAQTIGRRRLNFGVNFQRVTFDHLEGKSLSDDEIRGYTGIPGHLGGDSGVFYEDALDLQASTSTFSMFATYGLTNRLDIGVAVPINHVEMSARLESFYGDSIEGVLRDTQHPCDFVSFPQHCWPETIVQERSGSATGLGDVIVRAKYNFLRQAGGGLSAAIDFRLPTGDEENLLGLPGGQTKLLLVGSTTLGRWSPHINAGYTLSGASESVGAPGSSLAAPADEINYTVGADLIVTERTTAAFEVLGRTLREIGTLEETDTVFARPAGGRYRDFRLVPGADLTLLLGSAGVRFNPAANLLISTNFLFPLSDNGLTDSLTWLVGIDYSF
jgi:hypothetical protein